MMLNGASGSTATGCARTPSGMSHAASGSPALLPSSVTRRSVPASSLPAVAFALAASTKRCRAPESATMAASCSGVALGGSGAATTPARSAPRNTATYSIDVAAQIAATSPAAQPSRCSDAATRSIRPSSSP